MSNANKIARYITTIDSTPSYAINILVTKPMTVTATFFILFHPSTSSQSFARIHSVGIAATPKENILDTHVLYDIV